MGAQLPAIVVERAVHPSLHRAGDVKLADTIGNADKVGIRLYVDNKNEIAHKAYDSIGMDGDHYRVYEWMKT